MISELGDDNVGAYADDIYVFSDTLEQHICTLGKLFDILIENNLTVSLKKCQICYEVVNLLGFTVGENIIQP